MKAAASKAFVLDASVTIAWCFRDEESDFADGVLDLLRTGAQALSPAIWPLEVANGLLIAERRKRITIADVTAQLSGISSLPIIVEPALLGRPFDNVLAIARQEQLTSYDAAYLELALRQGMPVATLDKKLRSAAHSCGVPLASV